MKRKTERIICGTCEYWTGNRVPVFDGKGNAKVDIIELSGICENQNCRFTDCIRNNENSCKHHSKWTELL